MTMTIQEQFPSVASGSGSFVSVTFLLDDYNAALLHDSRCPPSIYDTNDSFSFLNADTSINQVVLTKDDPENRLDSGENSH